MAGKVGMQVRRTRPPKVTDQLVCSRIENKLQRQVDGKEQMSPAQLKAAELLYSRLRPVLSSVEQHNIDERDKLTEEEILSKAQALISAQPGLLDALIAIRDAMTKTPAVAPDQAVGHDQPQAKPTLQR